ncbi:MAG: GIY-YIG nuclease family protein [Muribaculaceae bacterium]|nr:GIY-YIG nuclease family protein [Muribaculaceae bacterium]
MNIDKELEDLLNDPMFDLSEKEKSLFDIPADMRRVQERRAKPDYVAQRKLCENFGEYQPLFKQVHKDLKIGRRSLVKITKTESLEPNHYYIEGGQLVLLESIGDLFMASKGSKDARTRCVFENGTESDILLQTLRRNVVGNGYAVTELQEETEKQISAFNELSDEDKVTGSIYILSSLSEQPEIANQSDLYKIGFTTNSVEERIADATNDPTYLLAPVKVETSYKIVNMISQKFEALIHQVLDSVQMQISIIDKTGVTYHPREWYVVPFEVIETIINKILDGSIVNYIYNQQLQCLEKTKIISKSVFDTSKLKVLTLIIKRIYFDEIMKGEKVVEYRKLKETTKNKYIYIDDSDGKTYLRRYDVIHFYVGYHKDRESALVEVIDIKYNEGIVEFHLGKILEHIAIN